jgi:hypothetical protein
VATDTFTLEASLSSEPASAGSGDPTVLASLLEAMLVDDSKTLRLTLSSDAPLSIPFDTLVSAAVVFVRASGGKVRVRVTSADGVTQALPADPLLLVLSRSVPFTALDLTRVPGTLTTVTVYLAQRAT